MKKEDLSNKFELFEVKPNPEQKLDFVKIFGNNNPVHLEIGSGRGEFLISKAMQNPDINYLAIELKEKRIKTILRQLDEEIHKNVKLIRLFVDEAVIGIIPQASLSMIYIIHPDPWPKKKHNRRRLIQQRFIDVLWQLLASNGKVFLSTDHSDYAAWIVDHFNRRNDFISIHEKGFSRTAPEDHIETHFEKMKKEEGFPPYFMAYRKKN
ncbi:MAG: tRNA (guanosine(46)-N7)-methyltransferase TrmB [Candidatus Cloacimonadota bacterium]|nr:MAG: tRNA (guanosine(46)-N7)-methyltransferase TrmB [Candidatus Cloacimonadota bacterium]